MLPAMPAPPAASTLSTWLDQRLHELRAAHAVAGCVIGYSGGLDSSVLLHALAQAPTARALGLAALHVNHGLHAEADAWQARCASVCAALAVPFTAAHVQVDADGSHGPEGAARLARMQAFADALPERHALALAHHQDDQAETFLLRALRGAGPAGLGAMRPWRQHAAGWLWRPLLDLPRTVIREYANVHGLHWIEDPANADPACARNALRMQVMPHLAAHWPEASAGLARAARLAAEAEALLAEHDHAALVALRDDDAPERLDLHALTALSREQRARVLRRWIAELGLPALPHAQLTRIELEVLPAPADARARVQWADVVVQRWRDGLHAFRLLPRWPADWRTSWDGRSTLQLPDGGRYSLLPAGRQPMVAQAPPPALPIACHLRARRGGERIRLPGRAHQHRLKSLLQTGDVPPWLRECLPVLCADDDGRVLAAGDRWIRAELAEWLVAQHLQLHWQPPAALHHATSCHTTSRHDASGHVAPVPR